MTILKKDKTINFFFNIILLPLVVLSIYSFSFAIVSPNFLLKGVNYVFTDKLWKYSIFAMVFLALAFWETLKIKRVKIDKISFQYSIKKIPLSGFLLLLLPLTPIVQYMITNHYMLTIVDFILIPLFFVLFSSLYIFIIPVFIGHEDATRTLMIMGSTFSFVIICMPLLSQRFAWFEQGRMRIQLLIMGGIFIFLWLLDKIKSKWIFNAFLLIFFLSNSLTQLFLQLKLNPIGINNSQNQIITALSEKTPVLTPNIYLLVYDSYVSEETMKQYGIDNTSQENFLKDLGFQIYPRIYSIATPTIESMSRVFEISNGLNGNIRKGVSGDGLVQKTFRDLGYKTYGIFPNDYMFRGISSSYDYSFPSIITPMYKQTISSVLIGEFRFDFGFTNIPHVQFVTQKDTILNSDLGKMVFLYSHSNYPNHSHFHGACLENQTDLYKQGLVKANTEMKKDVEDILAHDKNAIIIVAGDHGPYLTKNCASASQGGKYSISEISRLDIQDRFGTFLAIYWPENNSQKFDDIKVLQDVFPSVFAYIFQDEGILESRVFPNTDSDPVISGASVVNGIIHGGINNGEPLYLSTK